MKKDKKPFSHFRWHEATGGKIKGGKMMSCKMIPNIPRIAMFIGDQAFLTPFVGSLYAALQGMGENWSYEDILAMSGAGNRLRWLPGHWEPGNVDIIHCEEPMFAPHFRALKAVGWNGEIKLIKPVKERFSRQDDETEEIFADEETARSDMISSIDRGIPVIAFGIIGPPECCVVFGYEENGEKLVGWNYFQADEGYDAEKPFVKADWFSNLRGYILLTGKTGIPAMKESGLAAFRAIVQHARRGEVRGAKVGIAAWEAMLNQLENDDFSGCTLDFPGGVPGEDITWETSVKGRFMVYCDALCQIHERGKALSYYGKLANEVPDWSPELNAAIDAWQDCSTYGGFLWQYMSMDDNGLNQFRTPQLRKILAEEGARCMQKDIEAIEQIEKLLKKEDGYIS